MAAIVVPARIGPEGTVIFHDLHARILQLFPVCDPHLSRSLSIEDQIHMNSSASAFGESYGKFARDFAVPKNVSFEIDRTLGRTNGT